MDIHSKFTELLSQEQDLSRKCSAWKDFRFQFPPEGQVVPAKAIFGKINTLSRGLVVTGRQVDR